MARRNSTVALLNERPSGEVAMRWCKFDRGGELCFGILEGDRIVPVDGSPFREYQKRSEQVALADVRLVAAVEKPVFYATSRNYRRNLQDNIGRSNRIFAAAEAWTGYRARSAITAHEADIVMPADCPNDVYSQGELVVVIGKRAKNLTHEDAWKAIFGYTIGNDVTCATWAATDTRAWRGKNLDTWKPIGPWIETGVDVNEAMCSVRHNGREIVNWRLNEWYFSPADVLVSITRYITINPGDILMMGTEGERAPYANHHDTVEVEISGIGTLRNRFVKSIDWL
jgi:2-keto-4-pentenoate hydratase/2-oxohepta-3-ene-1,7-dioic acid hydratase in catechol pathway